MQEAVVSAFLNSPELEAQIKKIDANADGTIDRTEFIEFYSGWKAAHPEREPGIDLNLLEEDFQINADELKSLIFDLEFHDDTYFKNHMQDSHEEGEQDFRDFGEFGSEYGFGDFANLEGGDFGGMGDFADFGGEFEGDFGTDF